ncbi:hypothetical protein DMUE_1223 [Dictyocoela muelleri]|nr:hypothetical protein DMUE_1223 [Dictyocoela muelleri]
MNEFMFIKSQRNNDILIHNNYMYNKIEELQNKIVWRCQKRTCCGRVESYLDKTFKIIREHNHHCDLSKARKAINMHKIKEMVWLTVEMSRDIIMGVTSKCSDIEISELPREKIIYKNITRQRSKELLRSEPMISEIPDILKNNLKGEKFIRFDSGILGKNRYI